MSEVVIHMERTVLGAMILDSLSCVDGTAKLRTQDFALDSHQRVFKAINAMVRDGAAVDLVTLADFFPKSELAAIGGVTYLAELCEGIPRNPNVQSYVDRVLDRSLARRGIQACQFAEQRLLEDSETATTVLDSLSRSLMEERPSDSMTADQVMPQALAFLEGGGGEVIPTGIPELDTILAGGLRTKELCIIGAQPSAGKSALCRQFERSAVRHGFGIHAHSIEVAREKWMLHHCANLAGVLSWKLRHTTALNEFDKDMMRGAAGKISHWDYVIDDAGSVHIDTLLSKSRLSAMRRGTKLFTVDYLQMLSGDEENRTRLMGNAARKLKQFAKDNDVAVVVLSQLARTGDINARPIVQHLKESGDIEAAADVILLNYRPKNTDDGRYTGEDEIIIGKQREGSIGTIPLWFDSNDLTFKARKY